MQINGYILKAPDNITEIKRFYSLPLGIGLPTGDAVFNPNPGSIYNGYHFDNFTWTDPDPVPPTLDDIYTQTIQNQQVLKALVLCLNDGTLPVGTNLTNAQLKSIIKAKM